MSRLRERLLKYVRRGPTEDPEIEDIRWKRPSCPQPLPNDFVVFVVTRQGTVKYYLAFTSNPESALKNGIPGEAIIGEVDSSLSVTPEHFRRNSVFKNVLHQVIADVIPELPDAQAEARREHEGWLYIIDGRVPDPKGAVAPEDIFGGFRVENGLIVKGSYRMNDNHRFVTEKGLFRLQPAIHDALLRRLQTYPTRGM